MDDKISMESLERTLETTREGNLSPMYLYGTEMVSSYYQKLGLVGKKVLTVCGSGDQVFNAILEGASEVVCFDKNRLSQHIFLLKATAIKQLDLQGFLDFFGTGHFDASLEYKTYEQLPLPPSTKEFFDRLYAHKSYDGRKLASSSFFHQREFWCKQVSEMNKYLRNNHQYHLLQTLLSQKELSFINSDIFSIPQNITERFDFINISNIPDYLTKYDYTQTDASVDEIYDAVLVPLKDVLKTNGVLFYYNYSRMIYPHKDALYGERPTLSKPTTINRFRERSDFDVETWKVKGIFSGFDNLVCLRKPEDQTLSEKQHMRMQINQEQWQL